MQCEATTAGKEASRGRRAGLDNIAGKTQERENVSKEEQDRVTKRLERVE